MYFIWKSKFLTSLRLSYPPSRSPGTFTWPRKTCLSAVLVKWGGVGQSPLSWIRSSVVGRESNDKGINDKLGVRRSLKDGTISRWVPEQRFKLIEGPEEDGLDRRYTVITGEWRTDPGRWGGDDTVEGRSTLTKDQKVRPTDRTEEETGEECRTHKEFWGRTKTETEIWIYLQIEDRKVDEWVEEEM